MLDAMLPVFDAFLPTPSLTMVRFHRWDEILKSPAPDQRLKVTTAVWHFSRAMAYASTGNLDSAEKEQAALASGAKTLSADTPFGFNTAAAVLSIAENLARARIALAKNDKRVAVEVLKKAVDIEDSLNYDEPEDWYIPARESLGGALILIGDYAEAEKVFRAELKKHLRNGRALFGLVAALKAQGKNSAAAFVQKEFEAAWKNADTQLRVEDL